jgi:hypothetical protein
MNPIPLAVMRSAYYSAPWAIARRMHATNIKFPSFQEFAPELLWKDKFGINGYVLGGIAVSYVVHMNIYIY